MIAYLAGIWTAHIIIIAIKAYRTNYLQPDPTKRNGCTLRHATTHSIAWFIPGMTFIQTSENGTLFLTGAGICTAAHLANRLRQRK